MKTRPLTFTAQSVRALLDGRKTQSRRVIYPQPSLHINAKNPTRRTFDALKKVAEAAYRQEAPKVCSHGIPGDRLWVKETHWYGDLGDDENGVSQYGTIYRADKEWDEWFKDTQRDLGEKWVSPRYMFRKYSRITLEIAEVRVERLQDISGQDAVAEGILEVKNGLLHHSTILWEDPPDAFRQAWDLINAKRDYPWESNPWVWVLTFKQIEKE